MSAAAVSVPCGHLMTRVDSAHLDCVSVNLALLLACEGVADVRTPFAHEWALRLVDGGRDDIAPDLPPRSQPRSLERFTGYAPRRHPVGSLAEAVTAWRAELSGGRPVLVEADAFSLPWVPYHGREHMSHGFVVDGIGAGPDPVLDVVDPYENNTRWGRAAPTTTSIRSSRLADAVRGGSWTVVVPAGGARTADPEIEIVRNCASIVAAAGDGTADRLRAAAGDTSVSGLHRLALWGWLFTRARELHLLWLGAAPDDAGATVRPFAHVLGAEVVPRWRRLQEVTYIAVRRAEAGRSVPDSVPSALADVLDAEVAVARSVIGTRQEEVVG